MDDKKKLILILDNSEVDANEAASGKMIMEIKWWKASQELRRRVKKYEGKEEEVPSPLLKSMIKLKNVSKVSTPFIRYQYIDLSIDTFCLVSITI